MFIILRLQNRDYQPVCRWTLLRGEGFRHTGVKRRVPSHCIMELYLGLTFWEPLVTFLCTSSISLASFSGDKYILLFICHTLGASRIEILFRAYRHNFNKTQSLYNYLLNHTTLTIWILQHTLHQLLTNNWQLQTTNFQTSNLLHSNGLLGMTYCNGSLLDKFEYESEYLVLE
jgi:hypothetical protein